MNDGAYQELGGQPENVDSTDAWDVGGAIYEPCPTCGAPADKRCVVETASGLKERRMPCIARLHGSEAS